MLPPLPLFSLSSSSPISSHPASLRSLNQRLHNVKITQYKSLHYASSVLPARQNAGWWNDVFICMHLTGENEDEERLDWGRELMGRNKRRLQCCRVNMVRKLTNVDTLHKRIWLRTAVSILPSPLLLFLFPSTLCHFLLQPFLCQHYFTVHCGLFPLFSYPLCPRLLYLWAMFERSLSQKNLWCYSEWKHCNPFTLFPTLPLRACHS